MSKCEQIECEQLATHRMHWPGKSLDCCEEHRNAANSLADAMGFSLSEDRIEPKLTKPITDPTELCAFICAPLLVHGRDDQYTKHEKLSVQVIKAAFAEIRKEPREITPEEIGIFESETWRRQAAIIRSLRAELEDEKNKR